MNSEALEMIKSGCKLLVDSLLYKHPLNKEDKSFLKQMFEDKNHLNTFVNHIDKKVKDFRNKIRAGEKVTTEERDIEALDTFVKEKLRIKELNRLDKSKLQVLIPTEAAKPVSPYK
jgi:hypothetical protein